MTCRYVCFRPLVPVLVRLIVMAYLRFNRSITITSTVPQGGTEHEHDSAGDRSPRAGDHLMTFDSLTI
jgi:hypothetical protein